MRRLSLGCFAALIIFILAIAIAGTFLYLSHPTLFHTR
jgi:hypothetical protein